MKILNGKITKIQKSPITGTTKVAKITATAKQLSGDSIYSPFDKMLSKKDVMVIEFNFVENVPTEENATKVRLFGDTKHIWAIKNKYLTHIK